MRISTSSWAKWAGMAVTVLLFFCVARQNYLLFHTSIEVVSAVVAGCVFLLTLSLVDTALPVFFVIVGCGQGVVATFTLLHMAAYKGMGIIGSGDANLPTQLWIATRLVDAGALFAGVLMIGRMAEIRKVLGTYAVIAGGLLASLFIWPVFPDCFIEGMGLTPFKITMEYAMMGVLAWSVWRLHSQRDCFSPAVLRRLEAAYGLHIAGGMFFTLYTDVYGLTNVLGHLMFFVSYLLLADALVRHTVREPQAIWFQDLYASETRMRVITDSALDAIVMMDPNGHISYWNPSAERILGYTADEAVGKELHALIAPSRYHEAHNAAIGRFHKDGYGSAIGAMHGLSACHKNGHEIDVELSLSSIRLLDGWHAVGFLRDITDRKQAEAVLRESEARYHALMEQSFEALVLVDIETQEVVEVNRRFTELLGYSLPEDAPLHVKDFVVDSKSNLDRLYNVTLRQQRIIPAESRIYRRKNGAEVPAERAGTVISIGGRDFYLASMRDMTAERHRQAELNRDVELASRVQQGLLPELPESPFVTLRTLYHPSHFISGDSYHMEWRNEGSLLRGFLVDVSGHGVATAIQTASVNVLLREASTSHLPLLGQMRRVNARALKYFAEGAYAAIIGFELDLSLRELRYVGAGITQFYANGQKIETPGMFVGLWEDAEFTDGKLAVNEGDCFHFLTDGFTDQLAQPENAGFWSPAGKDFDRDVAALEKLALSGTLRDDATGICIRLRAFPDKKVL